jgi:hypothetical protein
LAIFHTPDGKLLSVQTKHITAVRPVTESSKSHLAPGTNSVIYVGSEKFAITETREEADEAIRDCVDDGVK